MYVYDYTVHSIPRCHYKWAGIKRVEPISRVRFNRVSSYKEPVENTLYDKPKGKEKEAPPPVIETPSTPVIIAYTQTGATVNEPLSHTLDISC